MPAQPLRQPLCSCTGVEQLANTYCTSLSPLSRLAFHFLPGYDGFAEGFPGVYVVLDSAHCRLVAELSIANVENSSRNRLVQLELTGQGDP